MILKNGTKHIISYIHIHASIKECRALDIEEA